MQGSKLNDEEKLLLAYYMMSHACLENKYIYYKVLSDTQYFWHDLDNYQNLCHNIVCHLDSKLVCDIIAKKHCDGGIFKRKLRLGISPPE